MKIHLDKAARLFRRYLAIEALHNAGKGVLADTEDKLAADVRAWLEQVKPAKGKGSDRKKAGRKC